MADKFIPRRALEFFKRKGLKPTEGWTDLWHGEHARYFTVAQSVYADILNDVHSEIEKALTEGITLRDFQKNLKPILIEKGWWGKTEDGVQLGSPRRLKTIYDTNLRTSHAAGYWESIQEHKEDRPYLRYVAVMDEKTREQHRNFNNIVLPVDDPFWLKYYPPNGWNCRCRVIQMSEEGLKRSGLSISQSPDIKYKDWMNKSTGEVKKVPVGISPGFDYNVGVANLRVKSREQIASKLQTINPEIASGTIKRLIKSEDFEDFYNNPHGYYSVGVVDDVIKTALKTPANVCLLSDETLLKNQLKHPELSIIDYKHMNSVLQNYDILVQDSEKSIVAIKEVADKKYWLAVKVTRKGDEILTNTYHLTHERQIKGLINKGKRLK